MDANNVNERILELCRSRGWSLYRLALNSDIAYSVINNMIKHNHIPGINTLQKICKAFQISLSDFFNSELFSSVSEPVYTKLWSMLNEDDKEKVIIYMYGLLHMTIPNEDFENDI